LARFEEPEMPKVDDNFAQHFNYEIWMLVQTYDHLSKLPEPKSVLEQVSANAFIEAFCVHARLLIEFFTKNGRATELANDFQPRLSRKVEKWRIALNHQITHLYLDGRRFMGPKEKIGPEMRRELNDWLSEELVRFQALLKPEYETLVQRQIPKSVDTGPGVNTTTNTMLTVIDITS
jgi:hypothetical protein